MHPVVTGNAQDSDHAGWFVGHFMAAASGLQTSDVEVKWSSYVGGEHRDGWGANRTATTLCVLVRGRFHLRFPDREVWLEREGEFCQWAPGVPHYWQADGETVVISVRWPSLEGDSMSVGPPAGST